MSPRVQKLEALRDRIARNRRPLPGSSSLGAVSEPELEIIIEEPDAPAPAIEATPEPASTGRRRPSSPLEIAVAEHSETPQQAATPATATPATATPATATPATATPATATPAPRPTPTPATPARAAPTPAATAPTPATAAPTPVRAEAEEPKTLERPAVQPAAAKARPREAGPVEVEAAAPAPPSQPIVRVDTATEVIDTFGEMLDHALALRPR